MDISTSKSRAPAGAGGGDRNYGRAKSFAYKDGRSSVEQHVGILLEDLSALGTATDLSHSEKMVLEEAFLGLHYVWRMRVHDNLRNLDPRLCERLRLALVQFLGRRVYKGPRFLNNCIPSRHAAIALVVFCGLLRDTDEFLETVNSNMSIADLRRALDIAAWLTATAVEDEEKDDVMDGEAVRWTSGVSFDIDELRKEAVSTTLYLARVLDSCPDWKELVDTSAHVAFEKVEARLSDKEIQGDSKEKALLAPKGTYWDTPYEKVLNMFRVKLQQGLTDHEVQRRREVYGDNRPPPVHKTSMLMILIRQLMDLIVVILIIAAAISGGMGDIKAACVLGFVIVCNTAIGFYQEVNAERAISALASLSVPKCTVVRDGSTREIDAGDLVPGDIVVLDEGNAVPADLRLCQVSQLAIIETLLTGESVPIEKNVAALRGHASKVPIGDRICMAFQSTVVSRGRGVGVVVNTGQTTEIGRISSALAGTGVGKTPLQKKLAKLGQYLVVLALLACGVIIGIGFAWDPHDIDIIHVGVSLALSVIPEGLVAIVTLTMAMGMKRMAKRNALVRQLPAVETLGSVTTVCSDKTGTITEGIMRARILWMPSRTLATFGPLAGGAPDSLGIVEQPSGTTAIEALMCKDKIPAKDATTTSALNQWLLACSTICNNSTVVRGEDGSLAGLGDQTEVALQLAATASGISWPKERLERVGEIAFDSDRKRMSVVCRIVPSKAGSDSVDKTVGMPSVGSKIVMSKGAPEVILQLCTGYMTANGEEAAMDDAMLQDIDSWCDAFSDQGLRTLALAVKITGTEGLQSLDSYTEDQVEKDLVFVGLVALADPPRKGIDKSIAACHAAGIRVCMITGDHVKTAVAIARTIGILKPLDDKEHATADHPLVMNGTALSSITMEQLAALNPFPVVFSRVSPDNKLNIVKALQRRGDIVAMTGDGVNDAPAIRQADVGVAMGRSGTDITRQAADIILADDDFNTIVTAVEEGRKILDNIIKFLVYLLSCNFSEVLLMLISVATGFETPLTALQILYANIVIDIPPSLALGAEGIEPDAMTRPPRDPQKAILGKRYTIALMVQALSISLLAFTAYTTSLALEQRDPNYARSVCFTVVFVTQTSHAFLSRSIRNSVMTTGFKEVFLGNKVLFAGCSFSVLAVVAGLYIPGFNDLFELTPIDGIEWLKVLASVLIHLTIVEIGKYRIRKVIPKSAARLQLASPTTSTSGSPHQARNDELV